MSTTEVPLPGGNLTGAVRVGDTVRKPAGPWTASVHALLTHLEDVGFEGAPRSLGVDERDRHVLTYLEGATVGNGARMPWPTWCWTDDTLLDASRWMRRFHGAVADFVPPEGAVWRFAPEEQSGLGVCHNDLGPYNAVWRDGLIGFIDWDLACPGDPRSDVAQMCLDFAPLLSPAWAEPLGAPSAQSEQLRRARLVLDAYEVGDRRPFADLIVERFRSKSDRIRSHASDDPVFQRLLEENADYLVQNLRYVESIREGLRSALA